VNIKFFEINKINLDENNLILLYGKNEALKNDAIKQLSKDKVKPINYDEKEILDAQNEFIENILNKSLFEKEKFIIIKRATDKIVKILDQLKNKKIDDKIIICSENLEKKSKLRGLFEKEKKYICVAFYPDNEQTLIKFAYNYLKNKKILVSSSSINVLINKCNGDRATLLSELEKIELFAMTGNKVTLDVISKLSNLIENQSISSLIDNCLAKNKKKIVNILNENSFGNEDSILIVRTFLNKSKKLLNLSEEFEKNRNIDLTISSAKPPVFWKDKDITKNQIIKWKPKNIKKLIYKLSEIELQIKKNLSNPIDLIRDFILDQSTANTNN
tara:strand:+ start:1588 stop:2577 length:990 start_codon:yes stop_codon:yes gene_type:complete